MPSKQINFGSLVFSRKGDAAAYLSEILNSYNIGEQVSDVHARVLTDALAHHPGAASKVGCGAKSFSVRLADYGTKCFWIDRIDGTTEKFSIGSCVYSRRDKKL